MNCDFFRVKTKDGLLLPVLYRKVKNSKTIVIHTHGMAGSFQENYVDALAMAYNELGYSFASYNNRGTGYVTAFIKKDKLITVGSNFELFKESDMDLDAVVNYFIEKGYENIILSAHSYGCNKMINYYSKNLKKPIKKLVLISPCDVILQTLYRLGDNYDELLNKAKNMKKEKKEDGIVSFAFYPLCFSCKTFLNDFVPEQENDIFRYRTPNYKSKVLRNIKIPVDVIMGENDNVLFMNNKEAVMTFLKNNLKTANFIFVKDCGHTYKNVKNLYECIRQEKGR